MMYQLKLEINQQNLRTKLFGIVFLYHYTNELQNRID